MKKFLYKLLPLILIFIFCFSLSVSADSSADLYSFPLYVKPGEFPLGSLDEHLPHWFNYYKTSKGYYGGRSYDEMNAFCFKSGDKIWYLYYYGDFTIFAEPMDFYTDDTSIRIGNISNEGNLIVYHVVGAKDGDFVEGGLCTFSTFICPSVDTIYYSSKDIYSYYDSSFMFISSDEKSSDNTSKDFFFDALEDFRDFTEENNEHYNNAMNQTVTENSNNPNDSVFQNILQAMVGSLTTNNSISQQISNQLQHFTEQFFNNFAQYSLGLMNDILNTLNEFTGKFDSLLEITGQLYESGLDSEGNFDVGTMLSYWFVPDVDGIKRSYDNTIGQINTFDVVTDTMLGFLSSIQEVEPVAPIFTISAGTYGLLTIKEDILIKFDWFESWKPYTDPLIAAFIYVTFFWHLFKQLPGIISGSAATTATVGHFNDAAIKDANRKAKGG